MIDLSGWMLADVISYAIMWGLHAVSYSTPGKAMMIVIIVLLLCAAYFMWAILRVYDTRKPPKPTGYWYCQTKRCGVMNPPAARHCAMCGQ